MILMSVQNKDGHTRRCDGWCYDAKSTTCHCVCGGKNHGVGEQQAIENTKQLARELEEKNQLAQEFIKELARELEEKKPACYDMSM